MAPLQVYGEVTGPSADRLRPAPLHSVLLSGQRRQAGGGLRTEPG